MTFGQILLLIFVTFPFKNKRPNAYHAEPFKLDVIYQTLFRPIPINITGTTLKLVLIKF